MRNESSNSKKDREESNLASAEIGFRGFREEAPGDSGEREESVGLGVWLLLLAVLLLLQSTGKHVARHTCWNADFGNAVLGNREEQRNETQKHQLFFDLLESFVERLLVLLLEELAAIVEETLGGEGNGDYHGANGGHYPRRSELQCCLLFSSATHFSLSFSYSFSLFLFLGYFLLPSQTLLFHIHIH